MDKENRGFYFWKHVDTSRGNRALADIASEAKINYQSLRDQRTNNRLPKLEDAYALAKELGVTLEFLLTGEKKKDAYPERIQRIIDKCMSAGETDLEIVERVLRIDSEGEKKSDTGSALA